MELYANSCTEQYYLECTRRDFVCVCEAFLTVVNINLSKLVLIEFKVTQRDENHLRNCLELKWRLI